MAKTRALDRWSSKDYGDSDETREKEREKKYLRALYYTYLRLN